MRHELAGHIHDQRRACVLRRHTGGVLGLRRRIERRRATVEHPGRHVEHITFRNISYAGGNENPSVVQGYSPEGMVRDVTFENVVIGGRRATCLEDLNLKVGDFVEGIRVVN